MQPTPSAFIEPGKTEAATIRARPCMYPAVRFTFRPVTVTEQAAYLLRVKARGEGAANTVAAETIVEHLESWEDGEKPSVAKLLTLKPKLFDRVFAIVFGESGSDDTSEQQPAA